jgi:hypothetical protein
MGRSDPLEVMPVTRLDSKKRRQRPWFALSASLGAVVTVAVLTGCGGHSAEVSTAAPAPPPAPAPLGGAPGASTQAGSRRTPLDPACDRGAEKGPQPAKAQQPEVVPIVKERLSRAEAEALRIGDLMRLPLPWLPPDGQFIREEDVLPWMPMQGGVDCPQIVGFIPKTVFFLPPRTAAEGPITDYGDQAVYDNESGKKVGWVTVDGFHSIASGYLPTLELRIGSDGKPVIAKPERTIS